MFSRKERPRHCKPPSEVTRRGPMQNWLAGRLAGWLAGWLAGIASAIVFRLFLRRNGMRRWTGCSAEADVGASTSPLLAKHLGLLRGPRGTPTVGMRALALTAGSLCSLFVFFPSGIVHGEPESPSPRGFP